MIGGGDTCREDLFYFAGFPAWRRGYNAPMVDLPGQGSAPMRGLTIRADMATPISASLDFLAAHAACPPQKGRDLWCQRRGLLDKSKEAASLNVGLINATGKEEGHTRK